jgi:hypothetical protein
LHFAILNIKIDNGIKERQEKDIENEKEEAINPY